jgi:mono/diheme cytochrome c family protein
VAAVALIGLAMTGSGWIESEPIGFGLQTVAAQDAANKPAFYTERVKPILVANCGKCHFDMNHKGGLSLATKASTMKGGRDGVVLIPGDAANSLLVKLIRHEGPANDPMPMPAKAPKMSDADIAVIEQWVKAGAVMPNDPPPAQ